MKKTAAILAALLAMSLFSHLSQADEVDLKAPGGAFVGKWKYDEVDPADAALEVERVGRRLLSVSAGYIANDIYREHWQFDNSILSYDKLSSDSYFLESDFNERDASKLICSSNAEQDCDILKSDQVSKNLIIVTFQLRQSSAACAGIVYVDEEVYGEGYEGTYGDYLAVSVSCVPAGGDTNEALALSAHYLSLVKKDGRPIARLSPYNLPKPSEQTRRSPAALNKDLDPRNRKDHVARVREKAELGLASAQNNFGRMYLYGLGGVPKDYAEAAKWYRLAAEQGYAAAQYDLGYMYQRGQGVKQDLVQAHAWYDIAAFRGHASAATSRDRIAGRMTPAQIAEAERQVRSKLLRSKWGTRLGGPQTMTKHELELGASGVKVCTMSTAYGGWLTSKFFQDWVEEAHRRNLSLEDCEKLLKAN